MTDDEREKLANILEGGAGYSAGKPAPLAQAAAQLRADGERIKALEEALTECSDQLRKEEARVGRIEAALADLTARQTAAYERQGE